MSENAAIGVGYSNAHWEARKIQNFLDKQQFAKSRSKSFISEYENLFKNYSSGESKTWTYREAPKIISEKWISRTSYTRFPTSGEYIRSAKLPRRYTRLMTHARSKSDSTKELINVYGSSVVPKKQQNEPKIKKRERNHSSSLDYNTDALDRNPDSVERPVSVNGSEVSATDYTESLQFETPREEKYEFNCLRLLLLSDKTPRSHRVSECCLPNVILIHYKNDASTLDNLLLEAKYKVGEKKVHSIAFMSHSVDAMLHLCSSVEKHFTQNPITIPEVKNFFLGMKQLLCNNSHQCEDEFERQSKPYKNGRADLQMSYCNHIDFLGMKLSPGLNSLVQELSKFLEIKMCLSQDAGGCDLKLDKEEKDRLSMSVLSQAVAGSMSPLYVGQYYFEIDKLRALTMSVPQSMAGFEKIRLVGKGAYGAAVLYRKKDDDSLVILKEINMIDLSATERQLALNEVKILSLLDHPNIISYYDHFEEDGVLIIEMEYADGGTLAQMLSQRTTDSMEEIEILLLFQQMVAALRHIHSHNVLHRDFKTDNIFLTKEGIVKLGDFGISKMMTSTRRLASTVLGTPYYISPELCEGKEYNEKSDIWALGCVLYEMACGQKTFDGSNLPALVNKIMKGQFAPIKSSYSQSFRVLIRDMLQRDPQYRPSAHEILYMRLPELMKGISHDKRSGPTNMSKSCGFVEVSGGANGDKSAQRASSAANKRSLVFEFNLLAMKIEPVHFPFRVRIKQISASTTHAVAVSSEMSVFTWGEGSKGQLGHENLESGAVAAEVESLRGKSIVRVGAGDGFTVFGCDNGILLTCGDGAKGCLGHGDWNSCSKARLIEKLLSVDIVSFGCGSMHVAAVSSEGSLYAWGVGADGRLGLSDCLDKNEPTLITSHDSAEFHVREVQCGSDGTMFLTDMGCVLACGSNALNKLGLNNRQGFLMGMKNFISKIEVEGSIVPIVVKCLAKHRVMKVCMGRYHTAVTVEQGHVYILGSNSDGQLGIGSLKQKNSPALVKDLENEKTVWTACGDTYTMVVTKENVIYTAGIFPKGEPCSSVSDSKNTSTSSPPVNPQGANASGDAGTDKSSAPVVLSPTDTNSGVNDSPQERNTSQNSNPTDNSVLSCTPPANSILKQPKSAATTKSALRTSNETGPTSASDLECNGEMHVGDEISLSSIDTTYICSQRPVDEQYTYSGALSCQPWNSEDSDDKFLLASNSPVFEHPLMKGGGANSKGGVRPASGSTFLPTFESESYLMSLRSLENLKQQSPSSRRFIPLLQCSSSSVVESECMCLHHRSISSSLPLFPLSNVPEEIGLAFHVSEPAASPSLNFAPIIKFVPDVYSTSPQQQSNTDVDVGQATLTQKPSSSVMTPAKSVDVPETNSASSSGRHGKYDTTIEFLVCSGSQSYSLLISIDTDAPMPKKGPKRRRIRRFKENGSETLGGQFEDKPGASSTESSLNNQSKKRFSGGISSQDGDYTTEGDSELSEQDGPVEGLQQTSSSTVPTWLRKELADEFVPIPSSTGLDSCYSSEEENADDDYGSRKNSDGSNTNENQEEDLTPRGPTITEHVQRERNSNHSKMTQSKWYHGGKDESSRPDSTSSYDLHCDNNFNKRDVSNKLNSNKTQNNNQYMSTSNSSADLVFNPALELPVKPTTAKQRSPNRPSSMKPSNGPNFPAQSKNTATRRATTAAAVAPNRPGAPLGRGVSSPYRASERTATKPTAIVGPESRRNNAVGLKSSNETRLEEELAQLRREKEEMMQLIQQMQQDHLISGEVTRRSEASTTQSNQASSHVTVSDTLRDEMAQMRNELVSQRRLLAENAAEMNRLQQQITTNQRPSQECGGPDGLTSPNRPSDEYKQQFMRNSPSQHSSITNDSRSSNENTKPKTKASKVCSLS